MWLRRNGDAVLLCLVCAAHVLLAPYTKVEESFNIQAIYDLLFKDYRHPETFDHYEFPGVVPRTFLAPVTLATLVSPLRYVLTPVALLCAVRLALAGILIGSLLKIRHTLTQRHTATVGQLFILITASQFHIPYYAGRTLPNIFALILTNIVISQRLHDTVKSTLRAHVILAFAVAVFRSELSLLLFAMILYDCYCQRASFFVSAVSCLLAAFIGATLSIAVDSYFWPQVHRHPFRYPELEVFYFNTILNRSSAWGTSPWHWYFTHALPRALIGAAPLAVLGAFASRGRARRSAACTAVPALCFVAMYSALPHKELRFVFYAVPALNVAAAHGAAALVAAAYTPLGKDKREPSVLERLSTLSAVAVCLAASACVTIVSLAASHANYPGAHALLKMKELRRCDGGKTAIHVDAHAASNGVSQFIEKQVRCPEWTISREEGLQDDQLRERFTHLVSRRSDFDGFRVIHEQHAFRGLDIDRFRVVTGPDVYVLERIAEETKL